MEANPEKISWRVLSQNKNIDVWRESTFVLKGGRPPPLEANPEKIDWHRLSRNPNAIELLEANPEKIVWEELSINKNIDLWRAPTFVL